MLSLSVLADSDPCTVASIPCWAGGVEAGGKDARELYFLETMNCALMTMHFVGQIAKLKEDFGAVQRQNADLQHQITNLNLLNSMACRVVFTLWWEEEGMQILPFLKWHVLLRCPMGKISKEVPRPLFSIWKVSHAFVLVMDIFPSLCSPFRSPFYFLSFVSNISSFFLTHFSHHRWALSAIGCSPLSHLITPLFRFVCTWSVRTFCLVYK